MNATLIHMGGFQGADKYGDVPVAAADAELDPHFVDLRGKSNLPPTYMPPAMPGEHKSWQRLVAVVLIVVFVSATAAGVCLTYGVDVFG